MRPLLFVLLLLAACFRNTPSIAAEFTIGEYSAVSLTGEARLLPETNYVSFAGDFGFSRRLPPTEAIKQHLASESKLLANFHLSVINLEFMLSGLTGKEIDRQIDELAIATLRKAGYDVVSRANNHAMDYGAEGVSYNTRLLEDAGFKTIGPRSLPVYKREIGGLRLAIFSLTDYTDRPDPDGLVLKIAEKDLELIRKESSDADFRIGFIHLGSMGLYPSPHERGQVARILEAGADLVVCTGSHFTKGFVYEKGTPVVYDIGNHLLSYTDSVTEPVGMHFVAGFKDGALIQLFVVPFYNDIYEGRTGPLDESDFVLFKQALLDRSTSDPDRYYADPSSLERLKERLQRLSLAKFKQMRLRHVLYGFGILYHHYPAVFIGSCLLSLILAVLIARWTILAHRNRRIRRREAENA